MSILNKVSEQLNSVEKSTGFIPTVHYEDGSTEPIVFCCMNAGNIIDFYTQGDHYILNGNTGVFYRVKVDVDKKKGRPITRYTEIESIKEIDIFG